MKIKNLPFNNTVQLSGYVWQNNVSLCTWKSTQQKAHSNRFSFSHAFTVIKMCRRKILLQQGKKERNLFLRKIFMCSNDFSLISWHIFYENSDFSIVSFGKYLKMDETENSSKNCLNHHFSLLFLFHSTLYLSKYHRQQSKLIRGKRKRKIGWNGN